MQKPDNAVDCWFVSEDEVENALNGNRPFDPRYLVYAYFLCVNRRNDNVLEGYIGRCDQRDDFHNQIISQYGYFNDYNSRKIICLSFDKVTFYEVTEIFPSRPLLFSLKKINWSVNQKEYNAMPKNFEIERRETFEKPYLKVFLKHDSDFTTVARQLESLHSVRRANVTKQTNGKTDLTIYPAKAYEIEEVEQEVTLCLENHFKGNPIDPAFVNETLSKISEKAYYQILDYIILLGKNLEGFKELNTRFDEERYRDYFIPFLNAISKDHAAKGEVFNRSGKTDILVFDNNGNNVFIAECKLWKGDAYLAQAIDQLLHNYVNWRDEKVALIIFNRDVRSFSEVVKKAQEIIASHSLHLQSLGARKDTSFSYLFHHPDDQNKIIQLELVLLNFA